MLKNSSIYLTSTFVSILVNFLTLPIFTQYLSVSDYGLVALFILFGSVTVNSLSFGLQSAAFRFYFELTRGDFLVLNTTIVLFLVAVFIAAGTFIIFPFSEWISDSVLNNEISSELLELSFISGIFHYFYVYFNHMLTVQKRALSSSVISVMHVSINALLTFSLISFYSMTYEAAIYAFLITNIVVSIFAMSFNYYLLLLGFSLQNLKKSIIFAYAEVPSLLVGMLYGSFDKGMLANYEGKAEIGYYEFGSKFAILLKAFMDAISKSWIPYFMENAERRTLACDHLIIRRFYELAILFSFVGLGVSYFTEEALYLLTPTDFHQAKYLTPLLVFYYIMGTLGFLSVNQLMFAKKLVYNFPASVLGLCLNILLNMLLIPLYGAMGAVISTAISTTVIAIVLFYFGNKVHPLPIRYTRLIQLFSIIVIYILLVYPVLYSDWWFAWKVVVKTSLLLSFLFVSIKLEYIDIGKVKSIVASMLNFGRK